MKFQRECLYPYVRISYTATLNISPIRNSSCQIVSWKKPTNAIPIPMFRSVQDLEIASVYIFEKKTLFKIIVFCRDFEIRSAFCINGRKIRSGVHIQKF